MPSVALMRKTLRDRLPLWAALLVLVLAFVVLFMLATNTVPMERSREMIRLPFVRRFMTVMVGSDPLESFTPTAVTAFAFTHPLTWVLLISFVITVGSGALAGEVDRGTMDILAALPVSRAAIYNSTGLVLLAMGLPLCWAVWLGAFIGRALVGADDVRMDLLVRVAWNLCATYVLIASFTLAISAACNRRGMAAAAAFLVVFYAFVLNLLRAMWPALDRLAWTGFLHYYQTLLVIRDEAYRWGDIAVLLVAAGLCWAAGLTVFTRRDFPAR